jgi:hypothetical protein
MVLKGNLIKVINPNFFANPAMVTYTKFPWIFDVYTGFNHHTLSYLRSKGAKQKCFKRRKGEERGFKDTGVYIEPNDSFWPSGTGIIFRVFK